MEERGRVLKRFHEVLVDEIRQQRPEYLSGPFTVAEIYQNLVPYGSHRDLIGVEMNGDYEDALLRLLAGEGGYLVLESDAALRNLREELETSNPNTGLYREFAAVDVRLNQAFVDMAAVASDPVELEFMEAPAPAMSDEFGAEEAATDDASEMSMADLAPPEEPAAADLFAENDVEDTPAAAPHSAPAADGPAACRWCRADLPQRENLNFCPFCGQDVHVVPCPNCSEELEPAWSFCLACGTEVAS